MIFLAFLFLLLPIFLYFGGVFNKTIIPLALVGYEMIIANSANLVPRAFPFLIFTISKGKALGTRLQLGATRLVGYLLSHIQRALME